MGWVKASVEPLERRPLQCFRCFRHGHVPATCRYTAPEENRRGRCYRYGDSGHEAAGCKTATVKCPLCTDFGRPAGYRLSGKACAPIPRRKKRGAKKAAAGTGPSPTPAPERSPAATPAKAAVEDEASQLTPVNGTLEEEMEVKAPPTA
ncbi:uncharacterized protein LOC109861248 [Pseudomyrmex gracilis]|uniref:uncharacterized protein LOC109861248 n=1 Tax=Pseudomyrmex gracilis TaxID=219809 RepID=UPI000995B94B|nr:uncharacterized protein LOC109861248 [Pseudomyrmex gracilis]